MPTVAFSAELAAPASSLGDMVFHRGKVFHTGEFPDKGFSLNTDEARAAVSAFSPVNADLEHKNTILDGKLGGLVGVELGADNETLFGTIAEPKWMFDLLGAPTPENPRKVSLTWDKSNKRITGIAHTLNPRIQDAAVFNAYADFSGDASFRFESQSELDNIPDEDLGDPVNRLFPARTQEEFRTSMSELANAADPSAVKARLLEISQRKGFKDEQPVRWPTPGVSVALGTDPYSCYSAENPNMKFFTRKPNGDQIVATADDLVTFTGGKVGPDTKDVFVQDEATGRMTPATPEQIIAYTGAKVVFSAPAPSNDNSEVAALKARLEKMERDHQATFAQSATKSAKAKYDELLAAKKCTPAEEEEIVAAFTIANRYEADKANLAYFSADDDGAANFSMSKFVDKLLRNRNPHKYTEEQVKSMGKDAIAVFDNETTTVDGDTEPAAPTMADAMFARAKRIRDAEAGGK
jgi:hypothetical protein